MMGFVVFEDLLCGGKHLRRVVIIEEEKERK